MVSTDGNMEPQRKAVLELTRSGLDVVPHVPASVLQDDAATTLQALQQAGCRTVLCLGGNKKAAGWPRNSTDLAEICVSLGLGVAYAGFPEGPHPAGGSDALEVLREKTERIPGSVVSQFTFQHAALPEWLDACLPLTADHLFVGVVGPATPTQLARFAGLCGVGGPSAAVEAAAVDIDDDHDGTTLLRPTEAVLTLAAYCNEDSRKIRLHLFPPFGSLEASLGLLHDLRRGAWPTEQEIDDFLLKKQQQPGG